MKKEKGFSLIELLMVLTIIGVISALAVPGLRKARQNAQKGSAIQSLRTITTAQYLFERTNNRYGTLAELAPDGTLDPNLQVGQKSEYRFVLLVSDSPPPASLPGKRFTVNATPLEAPTRSDHFFVDETAVIRFNSGAAANAGSQPIPR
jgi:prepilin-type N-terminal cleavage/methylation domain-containing protein